VDLALARGLNILSEKPIADTMEASCRIAEKVRRAGVKMGVTMSHRFRQDITTLRELIRGGDCGPLDYLVCRFTCECRTRGTWGTFRYDIPDPLLVEGSVHHLDLLADLAGAKCKTIYARSWQPPWGQFAGDCQVLVTMTCENGRHVMYEGAKANAVGLNGWGSEYIRAECRGATLILSHGKIQRFDYDPARTEPQKVEGTGRAVPLLQQPKWANAWLVEKFVRWLDGGPTMETNVQDNLQSVALIFAAAESGRTGRPVEVQDFLARARQAAGGT
jgi:predicted dehydrogenase